MKRVYLFPPNAKKEDHIEAIRHAAVAIAIYACDGFAGRVVGDKVFEYVTEKRQSQNIRARKHNPNIYPYLSCGDLAHYMLFAIGCRDEKLVNRDTDGGDIPWRVGVNISRLSGHPAFVAASKTFSAKPGDILCAVSDKPGSEHASILVSADVEDEIITTCDYGQKIKQTSRPDGEMVDGGIQKRLPLVFKNGRWCIGLSKYLLGYLDISKVPLSETAIVPDDYDKGTPDDNPYYSDYLDY